MPSTYQNQFRTAYVHSLPLAVQEGLFKLEPDGEGGTQLVDKFNGVAADRVKVYDGLLAEGYGPAMIDEIMGRGWDPWDVMDQWSQDGIGYVPPAMLNGVRQGNLGTKGQYGLPQEYQPGINLGPYPKTKPEGWITIPPTAELKAEGADVPKILKQWFGTV